MKLLLDNMPFTTAIQIIRYCHSHGIDAERSKYYYDKIHKKNLGTNTDEEWSLEVPDHLLTWFRMNYGELE